jgi:GAF domain-containing protein
MLQEESGTAAAAASQAWLHRTLDEIVFQVRTLLDVTGVAFLVVDWEHRHISPAAAWFASEDVRDVFGRVLDRAYDPSRPGVTEAAIESGAPIRIARIEDWPGGDALHRRLRESLPSADAKRIWDWYRSSSFLSCPVRTSDGRVLGVLAIARSLPQPAFSAEDLRVTVVLADLAALALERSELLDREERRSRDEEALNRASQDVSRTLDLDDVVLAVAEQARGLSGAAGIRVLRVDRGGRLREVARAGRVTEAAAAAHDAGPGAHEVHVPLALGPRVLGALVADAPDADGGVERLRAFAPAAAAAVANAIDFERERRVAHALTAGFIPARPPQPDDHEVAYLYEPAGKEVSGGDVFGLWALPGGGLALLVGDVSGSGLEVAATAAMVRFFVEARTFDSARPAEVLSQTNTILRGRLPEGLFVPAFLAIVEGHRLRWCNAGHPAPQLLRATGETAALGTTGIPLGVDADTVYEEREGELGPGDVLVAATDGLWEARREGVQFGDARLGELLAEHGRSLDPDALVRRLREEAEAWSPGLHDDIVILAVRARR